MGLPAQSSANYQLVVAFNRRFPAQLLRMLVSGWLAGEAAISGNHGRNEAFRLADLPHKDKTAVSLACKFCQIIDGALPAHFVYQDEQAVAFLDIRPLFPGHMLLVPRQHVETLVDLPRELIEPLFGVAQLLARAVEVGLEAHGSFVAINNRVSQSVPHLHIHVVPRRFKDGLKGFFWPRRKYASEEEVCEIVEKLQAAIREIQQGSFLK